MGEMAEYLIEQIELRNYELADQARELLKLNNQELAAEVEFYKSDFTKMVRSILRFTHCLSKKQRRVLAIYIVNHPENYI